MQIRFSSCIQLLKHSAFAENVQWVSCVTWAKDKPKKRLKKTKISYFFLDLQYRGLYNHNNSFSKRQEREHLFLSNSFLHKANFSILLKKFSKKLEHCSVIGVKILWSKDLMRVKTFMLGWVAKTVCRVLGLDRPSEKMNSDHATKYISRLDPSSSRGVPP